ncbi:MAG: beta-ketoacyl-ACP synthase II [Planctomycetota bacterium]
MNRRVVVTGMGVATTLGLEVDQVWEALLAGRSGIHELRAFDTGRHKVKFGGDIHDFGVEGYLDAKEAKRIDRFSQLALRSAIDAVNHAGLDFSQEDPFRCGVIMGSGVGGLTEIEAQMHRLIAKGPDKVSPFTIPKLMVNAASGHVSIHYGLKGVNYAVATACASATNAMAGAARAIRADDADLVITGGSEAACTEMALAAFGNMKALSTRNDDPQTASRPFDAGRDGFVLSEGAGVFVFEELEHAKARGAEIHAEILGVGESGDGGHITSPDPEGAGAAQAMTAALRSARINPTDIDYINAHGTSTPLGDKAETTAIKRVFGDHAFELSVSSTKSHLGHLLGASGGVELAFCLQAIKHQVCPPTINQFTPDPACDLDYTPNEPKPRSINATMSNSFGFGGHNATIIAGRYA